MPPIEIPKNLADEVVALRLLDRRDVPAYLQAFQEDPNLGRMMGMEHDPTEESVRAEIAKAADQRQSGRYVELAITNARNDMFLGVVILHGFSWIDHRAEFSSWLAPSARGHGYAARAARLVFTWAFETLEIARLEMSTTPENRLAQLFTRRLGFEYEGTMRARNIERGQPVDVLFFGLLREDWLARRPSTRRAP